MNGDPEAVELERSRHGTVRQALQADSTPNDASVALPPIDTRPLPSAMLVVTAIAEASDEVLPGELVFLRDYALGELHSAKTNALGCAEFGPMFPGAVHVAGARGGAVDASVVEGSRVFVDLRIPVGRTVSVLVVDEHGRPVADADIVVWREMESYPREAIANTGRGGGVQLALGPDSFVAARKKGYVSSAIKSAHDFYLVDGELRLVLREGSSEIYGKVSDARGQPIPSIEIVCSLAADLAVEQLPDGSTRGARGVSPMIGESDQLGSYRIVGMPDSRGVRLSVRSPRYCIKSIDSPSSASSSRFSQPDGFHLRPSERAEVNFVLDETRSITVRVIGRDGKSIDSAIVRLVDLEGNPLLRGADRGWCAFNVPSGKYMLYAYGGEGGLSEQSLDVHQDTEVTVELEPNTRPGGILVSASGQPLLGWKVWVDREPTDDEGRWKSAVRTGANGAFWFDSRSSWTGEALVVWGPEQNGLVVPSHRFPATTSIEYPLKCVVPEEALPSCWFEIATDANDWVSVFLSGDHFAGGGSVVVLPGKTTKLGPLPPAKYRLERGSDIAGRLLVGEWTIGPHETVRVRIQ